MNNLKVTKLPITKAPDSEPMMIVNDLAKIYHDEIRKNSERIGVPRGYRNLLKILTRHNGISQYELASYARLRPPTVSLTLKKMEQDGYIVREVSEKDMRVYHIFLTEKGITEHIKNIERLDYLDIISTKGFSSEEKEQLMSLLLRLRDNLCSEFGCVARPEEELPIEDEGAKLQSIKKQSVKRREKAK